VIISAKFKAPEPLHADIPKFGAEVRSASGDGAFGWAEGSRHAEGFCVCESGVALRLPPQSKT
jgi:hypothetical protein